MNHTFCTKCNNSDKFPFVINVNTVIKAALLEYQFNTLTEEESLI